MVNCASGKTTGMLSSIVFRRKFRIDEVDTFVSIWRYPQQLPNGEQLQAFFLKPGARADPHIKIRFSSGNRNHDVQVHSSHFHVNVEVLLTIIYISFDNMEAEQISILRTCFAGAVNVPKGNK